MLEGLCQCDDRCSSPKSCSNFSRETALPPQSRSPVYVTLQRRSSVLFNFSPKALSPIPFFLALPQKLVHLRDCAGTQADLTRRVPAKRGGPWRLPRLELSPIADLMRSSSLRSARLKSLLMTGRWMRRSVLCSVWTTEPAVFLHSSTCYWVAGDFLRIGLTETLSCRRGRSCFAAMLPHRKFLSSVGLEAECVTYPCTDQYGRWVRRIRL